MPSRVGFRGLDLRPGRIAEGMSGQAATNYAGRSVVRTVDVPRTMALGRRILYFGTAEWRNGFLPKNQRYRCAYWVPSNASEDSSGKPIVMGATTAIAPVVNVSASSNIDSTGCPTPTGLWGVAWDDLDGHARPFPWSTGGMATDRSRWQGRSISRSPGARVGSASLIARRPARRRISRSGSGSPNPTNIRISTTWRPRPR